MRIDFSRYIKKAKREIMKDAAFCVRVIVWVAAVAAAHITVLRHFLYSLCPVVLLTGYPCPACGMTRSAVLVLRGQFAAAWKLQPFIYVLGIFVLTAGIWRYVLLKQSTVWMKWCLIMILFFMIAFYIYRMVRYFPDIPPMTYYQGNLLYRLRCLFRIIVF